MISGSERGVVKTMKIKVKVVKEGVEFGLSSHRGEKLPTKKLPQRHREENSKHHRPTETILS